jgi:hypothetical protein
VGKLKFVDGEVSAQLNIAQGTFTVIVKYLTAESTKYTAIYLGNYALRPGSCEDVEDEAYGDVNACQDFTEDRRRVEELHVLTPRKLSIFLLPIMMSHHYSRTSPDYS